MARVRPFRGLRYRTDGPDVSSLIAPPYDVINDEQRTALLQGNPRNVVALELPEGPLDPTQAGNRYETGAATWDEWRKDGTLVADDGPRVYVLEQRFSVHGSPVRRRAFILEVGLEPFSAGVVLPHERTLPKALGDRFELTKSTSANLSQVFALFDDAEGTTDALFDAATAATPVARATDADGVSSTLWASADTDLAASLSVLLADKRIFIADGHHRYTTALAYRDLRREQADAASENTDPAYDYVMMALVNMEDPELVVMPTHRVATSATPLDPKAFKAALARWFELSVPPTEKPWHALDSIDRPAFLVKTSDDDAPLLAVLRPDVDIDSAIPLERSAAWKHLDVAVLQELILDPLLDIHPDRPDTLDRLAFVKGAEAALEMGRQDSVAFVLRPTRMDQLREVAMAGETMPQKSTYFYPKLLSGLVFRSCD
ncbi:MAG: DUF1015 domain-containing protein [Coriobacteriia bacterium]|nr:DUF1015 domain-containing protein [Coriobacteriia bacterium]